MQNVSNLFYRQLPEWARPSHPVMKHMLGEHTLSRRQKILSLILGITVMALLIFVGYTIESGNTDSPQYRDFMYYPLVGAQLLASVIALMLTVNVVVLERQKRTWESLQVTMVGAGTVLRSYWMLVFYRMRWILLAIFVGRLGYMGLLMVDLTDFEGRAIDVHIIGIAPEVGVEGAVILIAALMTAAMLQLFVAIGLDAAAGILLSTLTRSRNVGILTTVALIGLRGALTIGSLVAGDMVLNAEGTTEKIIGMQSNEAWGRVLFQGIEGDLSLRLLNLESLGNLWADLDNGIYLGGIVLGIVFVQALLANGMILLAAWRGQRAGRI